MRLGLADRVALVTGGSSGIGLATVTELLQEGALVATCGRSEQRLEAALAPLREQYGDRLLAVPADVLDAGAMERMVASVATRWDGLDLLVNNAGRSRMSTFADTTDDQWREELDLKFFGVLRPLRAALPLLRRSSAAAVVNLNAVLARQPERRLVATSAARAGLLNLTKSLASELAGDGVRVNTVAVGLIDTGQWRRRFEAAEGADDFATWSHALADDRGIALGRLGTAEDVAGAIVYLLSERANYITGTQIEVAGGVSRYV